MFVVFIFDLSICSIQHWIYRHLRLGNLEYFLNIFYILKYVLEIKFIFKYFAFNYYICNYFFKIVSGVVLKGHVVIFLFWSQMCSIHL